MTRRISRAPRSLLARLALPCLGLSALAPGCHHGLTPDPVHYPAPPPLVCPALPEPGASPATVPAGPQPIDLPTALRLADAQNPEVALARERIREALARQDQAEMLWLPNVELGAVWVRHDGQIQRAPGEVINAPRSSLFVGGGPGLSVDIADALFVPLAARQVTAAIRARAAAVANQEILDAALAYIDLLESYADLQINDEVLRNARHMLSLTESHERAGTGTAADTTRARTEADLRERERIEIQARIGVRAAALARQLRLPPDVELRPTEPAVVPIALVPEEAALQDLIAQALMNRPELASNRAVIGAALERWRLEKVAPLVPTLRLSYAAGGFGGGPDGFFGNFGGRSDFSAGAFWQLDNFGLGNLARMRERHSQYAQAVFRQHADEAEVGSQVVQAFRVAFARRQELAAAQQAVQAARESYRLNEDRVRRLPAQARPIELLQAIQALARARQDYLRVIADYNRAQFRLYTALGSPPACALEGATSVPTQVPAVPPPPPPGPPAAGQPRVGEPQQGMARLGFIGDPAPQPSLSSTREPGAAGQSSGPGSPK